MVESGCGSMGGSGDGPMVGISERSVSSVESSVDEMVGS
jgi:hypothetical protein